MTPQSSSRIFKSGLCASIAAIAVAASAQLSITFETPTYNSGLIGGQDGWTATASRTNAAVGTSAQIGSLLTSAGLTAGTTVHSGSQAFLLSGADASSTLNREVTGFSGLPIVALDLWARPLGIRNDTTNRGNTFVTMTDGGTRFAGFRFGYYTNLAGVLTPHLDYASINVGDQQYWHDTGIAWDENTWYNIKMVVDFTTDRYDFYVDGEKINSTPIQFYGNNAANAFTRLNIYRGGAQVGVILDDITVVPEPSSIALLLLAGSAALLIRRKG